MIAVCFRALESAAVAVCSLGSRCHSSKLLKLLLTLLHSRR